jgi:hypothetical protein
MRRRRHKLGYRSDEESEESDYFTDNANDSAALEVEAPVTRIGPSTVPTYDQGAIPTDFHLRLSLLNSSSMS